MAEHYQISDFAKLIGKHFNTVDGWFKQLEEKQIHYINRVHDEKVYDHLDLSIALHIRYRREEKWSLEAIFHELPELFELRPFPINATTTNNLQVQNLQDLRQMIIEEIKANMNEVVATLLPAPKDETSERQNRINDILTKRRAETKLEEEAIFIWSTKPEEERLKKISLFRKVEDTEKKRKFIQNYIDRYLEDRLKKEYGIT